MIKKKQYKIKGKLLEVLVWVAIIGYLWSDIFTTMAEGYFGL